MTWIIFSNLAKQWWKCNQYDSLCQQNTQIQSIILENIKTGRQAPEYQCLPYNKTTGNMRPGGILHHKCKFTQNAGTLYRLP